MKSVRLVVIATCTILLTAACGSGSDESTSGGTNLKGDPIVVGTIGSYTGPEAPGIGIADDAAEIWAKSVNDAGGINGHPVKMVIKDDAGDPAKALQAAKELVEKDKVIAIVGTNSTLMTVWGKYVSGKGVPVVGGIPTDAPMYKDANFYPTGSNLLTLTLGQVQRMQDEGLKKLGILHCAESPVCAGLVDLAQAVAKTVGDVEVVGGAVSASQPSYSADCLALKREGVDGLWVANNAPTITTIMAGCAQAGFTPQPINTSVTVSPQMIASPDMDGALMAGANPSYTDESVPGVKAFRAAIKKYSPDTLKSPQFTPNLLMAWEGGKLFEKAAEAADIGPKSTPADVKKGLHTLKDETLDGLIPPTTYVEGKPTFVDCWFNVDLKDGKLTTADPEAVCPTPEQSEALQAIAAAS